MPVGGLAIPHCIEVWISPGVNVCPAMDYVPGIRSRSTMTLTRIKCLPKLDVSIEFKPNGFKIFRDLPPLYPEYLDSRFCFCDGWHTHQCDVCLSLYDTHSSSKVEKAPWVISVAVFHSDVASERWRQTGGIRWCKRVIQMKRTMAFWRREGQLLLLIPKSCFLDRVLLVSAVDYLTGRLFHVTRERCHSEVGWQSSLLFLTAVHVQEHWKNEK